MYYTMSKCQGDIPLTTKVDEPTRELVDELAGDADVSRAEILRRLLDLYHQSEKGKLECPSCAQTVRIRPDNMELASDKGRIPATKGISGTRDTEPEHDTSDEGPNTDTTASPELQAQITEFESVIENQQQELEHLQSKLARQGREITDLFEVGVSPQRVEHLEEQIEWHSDELQGMIPRIEALTEVSDLTDHGICPNCGDELTVEQPFTDLGDPVPIKCLDCSLAVGHRT